MLYLVFAWEIVNLSHCVATAYEHGENNAQQHHFLLGCVWMWCSCRFSIFRCIDGGARLVCCILSWMHTRWWFSLVPCPFICSPWSVLFGTGKRCVLCSQDTQAGHPSWLALAALGSGAILCFAAGGWAAATPIAPQSAMPNSALVAWRVGPGEATRVASSGVRGVEDGDVPFESVAGPTNVLESTAIASSAAASAVMRSARQRSPSARDMSQSHVNCITSGKKKRMNQTNSNIPCPAANSTCWRWWCPASATCWTLTSFDGWFRERRRESLTDDERKQAGADNAEDFRSEVNTLDGAHQSPGWVNMSSPPPPRVLFWRNFGARWEAWFTFFVNSTGFFPQGVQTSTDVHFLGHGPAA